MNQFYLVKRGLFTLLLTIFTLSLTYAATITVTSGADNGAGSLRQAVMDAVAGDVIVFDASTNGTPIVLLTEITLDKDLTVAGNGMGVTMVSGNNEVRIFNVMNGATVSMRQLTLMNGFAEVSGGALQNMDGDVTLDQIMVMGSSANSGDPDQGGGGIHNAGQMLIKRSRIMNNTATMGSGSGGGILNRESGTLVLDRTDVMNNEANRAGGGVEIRGGDFDVRGGNISGNIVNTSPGNGGGIHTGGGSTTIIGTAIENNTAGAEGGGVWSNGDMRIESSLLRTNTTFGMAADNGGAGAYNNDGTLTIIRSTITGNQALGTIEVAQRPGVTGKSLENGSASGGGVLSATGTTVIRDTEISDNVAQRAGGGVELASGTLIIRGGSITGNEVMTMPGNGGGIHTAGGTTMDIAFVTISNNIAGQEGGGVWSAGTSSIGRCTIMGNVALGTDSDDGGGGLFVQAGRTTVKGGSIMQNTATATFAEGTGDMNDDDSDNPGSGSGGGVLALAGTTLLQDVMVMNNEANRAGGGIEVATGARLFLRGGQVSNNIVNTSPGNGGGVHTAGMTTLDVDGTTFDGNEAGQEGGGIWSAGTSKIANATITNNSGLGEDADDGGGGLFVQAGSTRVIGGQIMGNTATNGSGSGGGVLALAGTTVLQRVMVMNNEANRAGGGIEVATGARLFLRDGQVSNNTVNTSPGNGGGVHTAGMTTLDVAGTTFDGNQAGQEGGGVWSAGSSKIVNATISNNAALGIDADDGGGGVFVQAGSTTIVGGSITDNTATATNETGGTSNEEDGSDLQGTMSGSGGGILNRDGASLTLRDVTITGNEANRAGGGIEVRGGTVVIRGGAISSNVVNTSPGNGGGIHTGGGNTDIAFTTFEGNEAGQEGGGLWNGGTMRIDRARIVSNIALGDDADDGGGGVFNQTGDLTILRTLINNNEATGTSGSGGGILSREGNFTIMSSNVSGNTANRAGGGAEVIDGTYMSMNTNYRNNVAGEGDSANPGSGGAFHITGMSSTVEFTGGTVSGNSAANTGGGLWNQAGTTMTVTNVSIMDNNADNDGGGIWNNGGTLNVVRSLVANNTTSGEGGGVYNGNNGSATIMASTVTGNDAAGVYDGSSETGGVGGTQIMGSTIAMNEIGLQTGVVGSASNISYIGSIISMNTTDLGPGGSFIDDGENVVGAGADLQALADNGGPTMTHAIGMNSDAIDLYTSSTDADQRGVAPMGGARDAGAFESDFTAAPPRPMVDTDVDASLLNAEVISAYPNPVSSDRVQVNIPAQMTEAVELRLLDQNGRVHTVRDMAPGTHNFTLPISDLTPGTYTLQAISGDQSSTTRIVVIR